MSYVIFGKASFASAIGLGSQADSASYYEFTQSQSDTKSGTSVAGAGDVNGDGYGDFIIGGPFANATHILGTGTSYVVFGHAGAFSPIGLNGTNGFVFGAGSTPGDNTGYSVASAGDVNGDGFDDLIIGAWKRDSNGTDSGTSYVLFGHAGAFADTGIGINDLNGTNGFLLTGALANDLAGTSVASAGDLNGDGFDDLIVGAPGADPNGSASGTSYVLYGRAPDAAVTRTGSAGGQTIVGGAFNDTLYGLGGDDKLIGHDGYDNLYGGSGNDELDGGNDDDTAHFSGARSDYIVTQLADGSFKIADQRAGTPDGTDTAENVESFQFADGVYKAAELMCFMPGTRIATPAGEVAVETLEIGDLVLTTEGTSRPVSWMGRQTVSRLFADPLRVLPIRIRAGALGDNVPVRDLLISPDHAILIDDVLIQAGALVNGSSIVRETNVPEIMTYYHVELDDHSLILAENTPAETFVDNADRLAFDNWAEHEALYPEGKPIVEMPYPRAKAHRQVPRSMRERLAKRGAQLFASVADMAA
jgi:hypothetical protein